MAGHFIQKCKFCGRIINQCRCPAEGKKITWGICDDCKTKENPSASHTSTR